MKVGTTTKLLGTKVMGTPGAESSAPGQPSQRTIIAQTSSVGNFHNPTPYSYSVNDKTTYVGLYNIYGSSPYTKVTYRLYGASGNFPADIINSGPSDADVYNLALTRLVDDLRGSLDLSIDFFQFRQTKRMFDILNPKRLADLAKMLKTLKQIGFSPKGYTSDIFGTATRQNIFGRSVKDLTQDGSRMRKQLAADARKSMRAELTAANLTSIQAADAWLEWNYGWRPLLQDIHDTLSIAVYDDLPNALKVKSSARLPYPKSLKRAQGLGLGATGYQEEVIFFAGSRAACRIECDVGPRTSLASTLAQYSSLNPASIAWEALPYSFVVDWFIEIGNFLRNIESLYIYKNTVSNVVITRIRACQAQILVNDKRFNASASQWEEKRFASIVKQVSFSRTVTGSLPIPTRPTVRMNLGWRRITSAAALLRQLIK